MYSRTTVHHTAVVPDAKTFFLLQSCNCGVCLLVGGIGATLVGTFITSFAYNKTPGFDIDTGSTPKVIGPILLTFGLIAVLSAIVLIIVSCTKARSNSPVLMQDGLMCRSAVGQSGSPNPDLLAANSCIPMNTMHPNSPYPNPAYSNPSYQTWDLPPPYEKHM